MSEQDYTTIRLREETREALGKVHAEIWNRHAKSTNFDRTVKRLIEEFDEDEDLK